MTNRDDDKRPPLTVVATNSDEAVRTKRDADAAAAAREDMLLQYGDTLRQLAGNIMRIAAGAGKPGDLIGQLNEALTAANAFIEAHRRFPTDYETASVLDVFHIYHAELSAEEFARRLEQDDRGLAAIKRGALRVVAAELLRQIYDPPGRQAAGRLNDAINSIVRDRQPKRQTAAEKAAAAMPGSSVKALLASPPPPPPRKVGIFDALDEQNARAANKGEPKDGP
jgi:hypothetical protein